MDECVFHYIAFEIECQFNKNSLLRNYLFSIFVGWNQECFIVFVVIDRIIFSISLKSIYFIGRRIVFSFYCIVELVFFIVSLGVAIKMATKNEIQTDDYFGFYYNVNSLSLVTIMVTRGIIRAAI